MRGIRECARLFFLWLTLQPLRPELDAKQSRVEIVLSGGLSTLTSAREVDEDG